MSGVAVQHSALYHGVVHHRRRDAIAHTFVYRMFQVWIDLDELPALCGRGGVLEPRWWRPLRFRRRDYLGPRDVPLDRAVRDAVEALGGERPDGPVRMLTNLCTFGYAFNPVTFYYCHRRDGRLLAVLAEITNTPWGERHRYLVPAVNGGAALVTPKRFHVSPFQPMEQVYDWRFSAPGDVLHVSMHNREGDRVVFDAALSMQRLPLTAANLRRLWRRHPWTTAKVILAIHWNALKLWWKGAEFHTHPKKRAAAAPPPPPPPSPPPQRRVPDAAAGARRSTDPTSTAP